MGLFDKAAELFSGKSPTDPIEQSQDDKDIVSYIRNFVEEARNQPARVAFESEAVTNTAYLLGFDAVLFDAKSRQFRNLDAAPAGPRRGQVHVNLIQPTIQNRLARLSKNPPRYDVYPESMSQEDKDAARLSLKALNNKWNQERLSEKRIDLYMWMQQAGYCWIKTCWDDTKGKAIPTTDEKGEPTVEYEGDLRCDVVSALEVYVEPHVKCREDITKLVHAKVRKISYFRDHYGEKGKLVKEEGPWLLSAQNLERINQMNQKGASTTGADQMKNCAIELAYFEKPSRKYPGGRMIITANGVLLKYDKLPIDEIPYVKFDDVKIGGKFHSASIITQMRPVQDQLNRSMRRKAEFLNKGLNLKLIAAKGHGLTQESMNDATEVLEYNPVPNGAAPQAVTPPQMPSYVYEDNDSCRSYMSEISGISEASKGQMPSASIPALGMQILQEADETRIGVITESNENSWADVGRHILKYMNAYYDTPRQLKESGADSEYTITSYSKLDLKGQTDVQVVKGSTLPNSKTLKRQELLNVYSQGLLGDPNDPALRRRLLQQLEFGDIAGVWEDQMIDDQQIERTIKEIEQGMPPQVDPDDNHLAHFEAKNRLRKTEKFLGYPSDIQQIFIQDLEAHKQFLMPPPVAPPGAPGEAQPPPGAVPTNEPPPPTEPTPDQLMAEAQPEGMMQ